MSGGFFDYEESKLSEFADKIFRDKTIEEKHLASMLNDLAKVLHAYDYWVSGDTGHSKFIIEWANFLGKYKIKFDETLNTSNTKKGVKDNGN